MKQILILAFLLPAFLMNAQVKTPQPSPSCKVTQNVGLTEITLEYSRPGMKDRVIFGDLVPYDKMWRTGANKNSIITITDPMKIDGQDIEPGSYAIFTKPGKSSWEYYFYTDTENWGTPEEWSDEKVALKGMATPMNTKDEVENFTIGFDYLRDGAAKLGIAWGNTKVEIPVSLATDEMVMKTIETTMAGPSGNDYYNAARFYRENGKDLDQALTWMDKALEIRGEKFWILRQKALLQADMKDYKGAIKSATRSLELAKEANYDNYIKSNEASIKEWSSK